MKYKILYFIIAVHLIFYIPSDAGAENESHDILNPAQIFFNAYKSYGSNEWGEAVEFFKHVPEDYILYDYAIYYSAVSFVSLGRHYEALIMLDKIIKEHGRSPLVSTAILKTGDILADTGNYHKAAESFRNFTESFPKHEKRPYALYKLAAALENSGESEEAQHVSKQLWTEYPLSEYLKLTAEPLFTSDEQYKRIYNMFKAGKYKNILEETLPEEERFRILRAKSLYYIKKFDESVKQLTTLVGVTNDNTIKEEATLFLGRAYASLKDTESALTRYREVFNNYPDGRYADEAVYRASILAKEHGDTMLAMKMLAKLIKEYPSSRFKDEGIWQTAWLHYENGEYSKTETYLKKLEKGQSKRFKKRVIYWQGKLLLKQGKKDMAINTLKGLCTNIPSYYGTLAKNLLTSSRITAGNGCDRSINLSDIWLNTDTDEITINLTAPENLHIRRAAELISLDMREEADIELKSTDDSLPVSDTIHAAILYKKSGNIPRSHNIGLNLLQNYTETIPDEVPYHMPLLVSLAYPIVYSEIVKEAATASQVDPYLIYAVISQESGFNETAVSRAGAMGLMQIMPKTGRAEAEKLYINNFKQDALFVPHLNIKLGTNHLKGLIEEFNGNIAIALAAYNAGSSAVKSWLKKNGGSDTDEFVENIPYQETRRYVEQVLSICEIYKEFYGSRFLSELTHNF